MASYAFTYPNIPEAEGPMYEHVREVLVSNQVADEDIQRCMVIVSESFTNAYLHGNKREPAKHILINLTINNTWITADIVDEGTEGSVEAMKTISSMNGLPEPGAENGRGIALIKHYADDVSFSRVQSGGLKVSVRLKRGTKIKTGITQL